MFFSQLAEQAAYRIDPVRFAPGAPLRGEFVSARFHSQDTGRNDRLADVLAKAIVLPGASAEEPGRKRPRSGS